MNAIPVMMATASVPCVLRMIMPIPRPVAARPRRSGTHQMPPVSLVMRIEVKLRNQM